MSKDLAQAIFARKCAGEPDASFERSLELAVEAIEAAAAFDAAVEGMQKQRAAALDQERERILADLSRYGECPICEAETFDGVCDIHGGISDD